MSTDPNIPIYLIRHAEAAKSWGEDPDPGLSETGREQAEKLAKHLTPRLLRTSFRILSSPLLRAQETARTFEEYMGLDLVLAPPFAEIPSPPEISLAERSDWLREIFPKKIQELDPALRVWRNQMIDALQAIDRPTLIFSHFMVLNTLVGWIQEEERLVSFKPDYCAVIKLEKQGKQFCLVEKGDDLQTFVN